MGVREDSARVDIQVTTVTINTTDTVIVGANPQRIYLGFVTQTAGYVIMPNVKPTTNQGIHIPSTGVLEFFQYRTPALVSCAWHAIALGPGEFIIVIEELYNREP